MQHTCPPEGPVLHLTGERTLPDIPDENYWFARHVAGYEHVCATIQPLSRVLDSGCGEGYGTARLAKRATQAVGLDCFGDAVIHAALRYPEATFVQANATAAPFPDESFDCVASLQVIEHARNASEYIRECSRLLRPGGTLVVTTPNRLTFTPSGRPKNPFHVIEFSASDLAELLYPAFGTVELRGIYDCHLGLADTLIEATLAGAQPPAWAQDAVLRSTPTDFTIAEANSDCLDLLATCTK